MICKNCGDCFDQIADTNICNECRLVETPLTPIYVHVYPEELRGPNLTACVLWMMLMGVLFVLMCMYGKEFFKAILP